MIVVDLNLLLYAVNRGAPQHAKARPWWETVLSGDVPVGLPWVVTLGFRRFVRNPRVLPKPLPVEAAVQVVDDGFDQPPVRRLSPTKRHWGILKDLSVRLGAAGNLTTDAHLAALAIEHGATLCSSDNDFARFPNLRWENPIA